MTAFDVEGWGHPFDPEHLSDAYVSARLENGAAPEQFGPEDDALVDGLVRRVESGWCPRCGGDALDDADLEIGNGSNATDCRCIPICFQCKCAEELEPDVWDAQGQPEGEILRWLIAPVYTWPINPDAQRAALAEWEIRNGDSTFAEMPEDIRCFIEGIHQDEVREALEADSEEPFLGEDTPLLPERRPADIVTLRPSSPGEQRPTPTVRRGPPRIAPEPR